MTVITMSRNELTRLRVLIDVADGGLSVADATGLIGVGRRQIYRLLQAFRADGADGLISRKRGGPSNRALGSVFRKTVLAIMRERYADFGPTLAAEKLSELHGLDLAGCGKNHGCGAICRVVVRYSRSSCREFVTGAGYCADFDDVCGRWAESGQTPGVTTPPPPPAWAAGSGYRRSP
jgi:hypothetical protein